MRPSLKYLLFIFFAGVLSGACGQKQLTVEDIFGTDRFKEPSLNALQWRPDGKAFSFIRKNPVTEKAGLYQQEVESGKETLLIDSSRFAIPLSERREKRFNIPGYSWFPDSRRLLLNSRSDLWMAGLADSSLVRLTADSLEERDPAVSPDGRRIAFLKRDNLVVLDAASRKERRLTKQGTENLLVGRFDWVYEEEFSIRTGFAWSPDSRRIAYWELDVAAEPEFPIVDFIPVHNPVEWMRYPKAGDPNATVRVGVVSAGGGRTRWMNLGADKDVYIPRVQWLPDGKTLAIQRLNRRQNRLDLLFADAESGASRVALTETDSSGWVDCNDMVRFLKDGRFLWASDRSDRMHLYLVAPDGTLIRALTFGEWDVTGILGVSESENFAYFESTEKSVLERHLYRVSLDGGASVRLTEAEGTHAVRLSPDCRTFIDRFSSVRAPARTVLCRADGNAMRVLLPGEIPALNEYRLAVPEFLKIPAPDGLSLDAMLFKPADFDSTRKYPALVYAYGGPASQTVFNDWSNGMGDLWHQLMLQKGYLIFKVDNRGTFGHGNAFMNLVYRRMGDGVKDQAGAAEFLKTLSCVDSSRIGIWGWSGGGWMTCLAMTRCAGTFKAGAAVAPVTDLRNYDTIWTERYMDRPADNPGGYDAADPVHFIDRYRGGLLLVHGASDDNVHLANSLQLAYGLQNAAKPFQMMVYPRKRHGIEGKKTHVQLFEALTDFFLKNL
jgi:dipeptidyl-peptidase 4